MTDSKCLCLSCRLSQISKRMRMYSQWFERLPKEGLSEGMELASGFTLADAYPSSPEVGDVVLAISHPQGENWKYQATKSEKRQNYPTAGDWDSLKYPDNDPNVCTKTALMWNGKEWVCVQYHKPLVMLSKTQSK